ncbi:OmcA/MtrC family decaheme c-type cytochrome [Shewanella yunxiaonensis]|uniref:OmcA/MtrC family decaheme c-type cytochrome n=1 Tax=Shewanella yunxiaonensis TaxID=2829809 RepID=A0ABX7YXL8_9GAMM|nr:OmcA/MtrC family decaheme c-type cytochrome [Shewanella yunxiaonensis]QUN07208.1 OmcA/MtrC family decaheme c-type cytochrome [Shewanella yunxiaonensis]
MKTKYHILWLALLSLGFGILAGCSDDNNNDSNNDQTDTDTTTPVTDVGVDISDATTLSAQIESVSIDDSKNVSVDFYLSNANGVAVIGLDKLDSIASLGVGIAKLGTPQPLRTNKDAVADYNTKDEMAESKEWISYINNEVEPGTGAGTKAATEWQAGIETSCKLDCIENLGSGHYRYTFSKALGDYSQFDGLDTSYDANATTRVYLELLPSSDSDPSTMLINTTYDFIPATGAVAEADEDRQVIDPEQACYRCHTADRSDTEKRLLMHGGKRYAFEGCVMCHTTYSADPETGNPIDMATLVHKIHQADYKIVGHNASVNNFSGVHYPGEIADCQSCHISDATAQASQYYIPTNNSCLSCHKDKISEAPSDWDGTAASLFHDRDLFPNAWANSCAGCHPDDTNPKGAGLIHDQLFETRSAVKAEYAMTMGTVSLGVDSLTVTVNFAKSNVLPTTDTAISALWLVVNGNPDVLVRPENNGQHKLWDISKNSDNVTVSSSANILTATISGITPADFGDTASAVVKAKMVVCADRSSRTSVACSSDDADTDVEVISDNGLDLTGAASSRTAVADEALCKSCHDSEMQQRIVDAHTLATNFAAGNDSCGSCHNPVSATSLTDGSCNSCHNNDTVAYMGANMYHTAGIDHIKSIRTVNNTLNYREMVHSLHAGTRTVKAMGATREEATYPQPATNCRACHDEGQLDFAGLKTENSEIVATPDATADGQVAELSPTVATCAGCHTNVADWAGHAREFGGVYEADASGGRIYNAGDETCYYCHAEGKAYGVIEIHNQAQSSN